MARRVLEDSFGSRWITAGADSVIGLNGSPGDPIVTFLHLKQPAGEVPPFKILIDHATGAMTPYERPDLLAFLRNSPKGIRTTDAARFLDETDAPSRNEIEKARRQLRRLVEKGLAIERGTEKGGAGGSSATTWFAVSNHEVGHTPDFTAGRTQEREQSRSGSGQALHGIHDGNHVNHETTIHDSTPLFRGGGSRDCSAEAGDADKGTGDWEATL